jgi:hypothetical protein
MTRAPPLWRGTPALTQGVYHLVSPWSRVDVVPAELTPGRRHQM